MPDDKLYLPEHFDGTTVSQVSAELLKRRGEAVELNGERVKTAGALGLQVLASATRQWQADDQPFSVVSVSEPLDQACEALGVARADVSFATEQVAP